MAQTAWPFENIDTTETQFSQWARNINEGINQGVGDQLEVTADGTGMTVSVGTGQAMIRGHYYSSTATESLTITVADPTNPRIDSVVLELDPTANTVLLKVLAGTAAASPVAPTLTQTDAGVYQLRLANIQVDAATLAIESGDVTDLRPKMWSGVGNWTTATRPTNPVANSSIGYNTTTGKHEYWDGASWVDLSQEVDLSSVIPKSIIDAQGDLIIGDSDNTPVRLAKGSTGQVLTATASSIVWANPASPKTSWTLLTETNFPNFPVSSRLQVDFNYSATAYDKFLVLVRVNTTTDGSTVRVGFVDNNGNDMVWKANHLTEISWYGSGESPAYSERDLNDRTYARIGRKQISSTSVYGSFELTGVATTSTDNYVLVDYQGGPDSVILPSIANRGHGMLLKSGTSYVRGVYVESALGTVSSADLKVYGA